MNFFLNSILRPAVTLNEVSTWREVLMRFRFGGVAAVTVLLFLTLPSSAQILEVPLATQEQTEWNWAAVSSSVLSYYEIPVSQCEAAEYTRAQFPSWHDFGNVDCCADPTQGCNYRNYNFGQDVTVDGTHQVIPDNGTVHDILETWGVENAGITKKLSIPEIQTQLAANRPFIIRWDFDTGGWEFLVGHGWQYSLLYYMDPWPGEGLTFSTYSWVGRGGIHTWTQTNLMNESPDIRPKLIIQKLGTGSGTITSEDGKIECGKICRVPYEPGEKIVLKAAPVVGSTFTGWTGCTCEKIRRVSFEPGEIIVLKGAHPENSIFTGGATCKVAGYTCSLTFTEEKTVSATFRKEYGNLLATPKLAFGSLKNGSSKTKVIRMQNFGLGILYVGNLELQGTGFTLDTADCANSHLNPGASCRVFVTFSPASSGKYEGQVILNTSDLSDPQTFILLTGRGHD